MKQADYAYSTAYIRALENRLLSKADVESLILAPDFEAAAQSLRDRGCSEQRITPENLDEVLKARLEESRSEVIWASPKDNILEIFSYKNDFHNLKAILKVVASGGRDFERFLLTPATVDYNLFVEAAANADFTILPEFLRTPAQEAFDALNRIGDGALAESILDKACMDYMLYQAEEKKNDFLTELIRLENTMSDIKIAERAAKAGKDKGFLESALSEKSDIDRDELILAAVSDSVSELLEKKGKDLAAKALKAGLGAFEKYADNTVNAHIRTAKSVTFGVEPVIAYIRRKESEIQTIRVILSAKHNGIEEDEIRNRLRDI